MAPTLEQPGCAGLTEIVQELRDWQHDAAALQLHPGDLGWFWRFGADTLAAALRVWRDGGRIVAIGLLDESDLIRLTVAPDAIDDPAVARRLAADIVDPGRGVLGEGEVCVEAPSGAAVRDALLECGWQTGESWTPLRHDLIDIPASSLRIEVVGPDRAADSVAVQRAAFAKSTFTENAWALMAEGAPFADARNLVGYDGDGAPVAAVTVWSAGWGRPGLVEPMGVHRDHRGRGYGRAICHAAGAALRELGSSSMLVCTPSSNGAAVAAYVSAGFEQLPLRRDLTRTV